MKAYRIVAIFEVGMSEYDSSLIFMPLKDAQIFFQVEGAVSKIEVFTKDADQVRSMRPEILQAVGPMVRILDWQRVNSSFFTALQVERTVMFLILTLIIIRSEERRVGNEWVRKCKTR